MRSEEVETVRSLFQADILLPAQFLDRIQSKSTMTPEQRLTMAVLMDALYCFQKYCFSSHNHGKALFKEAGDWVMDEDSVSPFSFRSICDHLGIDADYLRCRIFRWRDSRLASREMGGVYSLKRVTRLRA